LLSVTVLFLVLFSRSETQLYVRVPIAATWADRFSWCCWQRFFRVQ